MKIKTRTGKFFLMYLSILILAGSFYSHSSFADCLINGSIADLSSEHGNLSNVEISINDTSYFSDANGQYTTGSIEPGSYEISFSKVGYQTITFDISIAPEDETLEKNIGMTIPGVFNIRESIEDLAMADIYIDYGTRIAIEGGTFPYEFSLANANSLPSGLNLDPETGDIYGIPTLEGAYTFSIAVTDSGSLFAKREFTIVVVGLLEFETTKLPAALKGRVYESKIDVLGGISPYEYSISEGNLPLGLSLDSDGYISGIIPDTIIIDKYSFKILIRDSKGVKKEKEFSIDIDESLIINTEKLYSGIVDEDYSQILSASGGYIDEEDEINGGYSWAIYSGTLPNGLSLKEGGELSGTPTEATPRSTIIVSVTDNEARTTYKDFTIEISDTLSIVTTYLPYGLRGSNYNETIRVSGGVRPFTFTYKGSTLNHIILDKNTGIISVNSATAGCTNIEITVSDSSSPAPQTVTEIISFCITDELTITTPAVLPDIEVGTRLTSIPLLVNRAADNEEDNEDISLTWVCESLPPGLLIGYTHLYGRPTESGDFNFSIQATVKDGTTINYIEKEFFIHISDIFRFSTRSLPIAVKNYQYIVVLDAEGGHKPYSWNLIEGSLPDGLSFNNQTGTISGFPIKQQDTYFTIEVRSTNNPEWIARKELSLTVTDTATIDLLFPEDESEDVPLDEFLEWNSSAGKSRTYDIYYKTSSSAEFEKVIDDHLGNELSLSAIRVAPETTYFVKVTDSKTRATSDIISFKTASFTSSQAAADEQKSGGGGGSDEWYSCFIQSL